MTARTLRKLALCLALACAPSGPVHAVERGEARIKAGFLYNFAKYTEWPAGDAERVLCLAPEALPASAANGIDGLPLAGGSLRIRGLARPEESGPCDILYIGAMPRAPADTWLSAVANRPVLTISDGQSGMRPTVMIHVFIEGLRIRFDLYPDRARRHGLKFSSRLMNLADTVHNE